jgi:hypothetical protein
MATISICQPPNPKFIFAAPELDKNPLKNKEKIVKKI